MTGILLTNAGVLAVVMTALWALSLVLRDASIVDPFWGLGFAVVAWTSAVVAGSLGTEGATLVALTTVWGLRLAAYLAWRNLGKGEDFRYRAMRKRWGGRFPLVSLGTVFLLQGALLWAVSLPVQLGQDPGPGEGLGWLAGAGIATWAVGLCFETVGDAQLARFKAVPANEGRVLDTGLWRYTRHPNYFGDACAWWGLYVVALALGAPWWTAAGPLLLSVLLLRVSGVTLLERSLVERKPGYDEYVRRTSAFFPRPPRRR